MKLKKILGIILAVLFGTLFVGGLFALFFVAAQNKGFALWISVLIAGAPFICTIIYVGIIWLIVFLLSD